MRLGLGSRAGDRNSSARRPLSQLVVVLALCGSALAVGPTTRPAPSAVQFVDVTRDAGIDFHLTCGGSEKRYILESMCGGVAFLDYDNDGWLDILLVNGSTLEDLRRGTSPTSKLYHNNRDGTFTDVTAKAGLNHRAWGMGVCVGDYDNDGWEDIYITYVGGGVLYHNNGDGTFPDVSAAAGVAISADGREQAGMGVDFGDYDNDGWLDLVKTNFSDDTNNLYHNNGNGTFDDLGGASGFAPISVPFLGFGVRFFDYDNDGWKDMFVANGHVNPQVDAHQFGVTYAQRNFLFHNLRNGRFEEVGLRSGAAMRVPKVSRGLATGDFDNDGALDVLVSHLDAAPSLLRNEGGNLAHWIRIKTVGSKSNRHGFGARVQVVAAGLTQIDEVRANSSYLSASDPRLHFGLGRATRVDLILIRWPSGQMDKIQNEQADQDLVIKEGQGVVSRRSWNRKPPLTRKIGQKPSGKAAQSDAETVRSSMEKTHR